MRDRMIDSEYALIIQQLNNGLIREGIIQASLAEAIEAQRVFISHSFESL